MAPGHLSWSFSFGHSKWRRTARLQCDNGARIEFSRPQALPIRAFLAGANTSQEARERSPRKLKEELKEALLGSELEFRLVCRVIHDSETQATSENKSALQGRGLESEFQRHFSFI